MMSRSRRARAPLVLLMLAACQDLVAPALPPNAHRLASRPIQYATWWRMTEACSGVLGDLGAIKWYEVRGEEISIGGESYDGYWYGYDDRILLTFPSITNGGTVRHEMLHALLRRGDHPIEYFVNRCGAFAPCGIACAVSEANRGVPETARQIPSESISVSLALAPSGAPALSIDSGWVTMMVTATNTRAEPVWVTIWNNGGLGYLFAKQPGTYDLVFEPRWAFRAGESRSLAFDVQLNQVGLRDTLWGFFGRAHSLPHAITVAP